MDVDAAHAAWLSRRSFLKAIGLLSAAVAWPGGCRLLSPRSAPAGTFFTDAERATLEALVDRIIPPDADPGARQLGAAAYIEQLLTAFDGDTPFIFAGGPFSNRNPYPDNSTGAPGTIFPPDAFAIPAPLGPLQDLYWRAEILGGDAAGLPEFLTAQRGGTLVGLRDVYRAGLATVDSVAQSSKGALFAALGTADQDAVLAQLDTPAVFPVDPIRHQSFMDIVIAHTIEGCFSAPEYGGNAGGAGWQMLGIEGDDQPLGYSIYSISAQGYVERPDHPMSTPNPDEIGPSGQLVPRPLSADGDFIQSSIQSQTAVLEPIGHGACF
ncbi:MAG TPA: gluconate 2-dehydrogenase subunit 3 family protein [Myxococcota bacterium]|nr:gluconate 2-dehydrogenase subunit 3 family protein [Myxococcota bacterium]